MSSQTPPERLPRYMTFKEVAEQLRFKSESTIYTHVNSGALRQVNVSVAGKEQSRRITRASFEAFCARIEAEAEAKTRNIRDH